MHRFRFRLWALMGLVAVSAATLGVIAWRVRESRSEAILRPLATDRLKKAQRLWEICWAYYETGMMTIDRVYQASLALLESNRAATPGESARMAALTAHRDRMRLLVQREQRAQGEMGQDRPPNLSISEYYLSEAECWLAEAKAGR